MKCVLWFVSCMWLVLRLCLMWFIIICVKVISLGLCCCGVVLIM